MKGRSKKAFAAAGATLAVAAGAGGALASGGRGAAGPAAGVAPGHPGPAAIASYLGLTQAQLRDELRSGKTLAQIALAQGKTVAGLEDAIYADVQAHLDQAVSNGRLTSAQEQTLLTQLKAHLDDIVNHAFPAGAPHAKRPAFVGAVASYLGLTPAQLRDQLRSGKSLAQIATTQGKSVDGLKAAILAGAKARLDKAVAAGRLTAAQETTLLVQLSAHLDQLVDRTGAPAGP
jgi:urease accessory protein UreF